MMVLEDTVRGSVNDTTKRVEPPNNFVKANLNDHIRFKLTESGLGVVDKLNITLTPDSEGWCEMQMHTFAMYFGDHMGIGFTPTIEPCIEIEVMDYD